MVLGKGKQVGGIENLNVFVVPFGDKSEKKDS